MSHYLFIHDDPESKSMNVRLLTFIQKNISQINQCGIQLRITAIIGEQLADPNIIQQLTDEGIQRLPALVNTCDKKVIAGVSEIQSFLTKKQAAANDPEYNESGDYLEDLIQNYADDDDKLGDDADVVGSTAFAEKRRNYEAASKLIRSGSAPDTSAPASNSKDIPSAKKVVAKSADSRPNNIVPPAETFENMLESAIWEADGT